MTLDCQQVAQQAGSGVAAALRAVDCTAGNVTAQAFGRLFAPGGSMATVLTILLTIYIAVFGLQLLTGRATIGVRALTPRMITVGLVLTFATSWLAYQSVVWNLAIGAPDWLAGVVTGSQGSATDMFAQKIDVVFLAVQEAGQGATDVTAFSPEGMMWLGAMLFLLGTVGLLVTARIALALLVALGPIFVVMALFNGTRGLFAGWLKGVAMLALAPLFAVLGGSVMLELAVPILAVLVASPGQVDPQAAMGFFMIGAVHVALMILVLKTAATMVGGWTVFGMASSTKGETGSNFAAAPATLASQPAAQQAQAVSQTMAQARRIDLSAQTVTAPANDAGARAQTARARSANASAVPTADDGLDTVVGSAARARGIGSRFRSANSRPLEKKT